MSLREGNIRELLVVLPKQWLDPHLLHFAHSVPF